MDLTLILIHLYEIISVYLHDLHVRSTHELNYPFAGEFQAFDGLNFVLVNKNLI